jgi:luciferase family oxidoreductase group 1
MRSAPDFYFDEMAQIIMDRWSSGRVALVGDAGYCCSPMSGQRTSVALLGAYILAGELAEAGRDHERGFGNYYAAFHDYILGNQWLATDDIPGGEPIPPEEFYRVVHSLTPRTNDFGARTPAVSAAIRAEIAGNVAVARGVDLLVQLSVLDLVPVRTDQTTSDALAATVGLAQTADRLGFTRYWVAEHHNMPSVAATSPPVLIAYLAAQTSQLRLGSGGVMLPNHAPLAVAEQFALLEAAAPGRIDLGIGRAPGSDPITSLALRGAAGRDDTDIENFPQYLDDVVALMGARGVRVPLRQHDYVLKATPAAASEPRLWLLGSSMYSARLAAAKGLPYVFAHHFFGHGTAEALAIYRSEFVPSDLAPEPVTFITVNAVVAPTRAEAEALILPNLQMMARLRTNQPLAALDLVEDAEKAELTTQMQAIVAAGLARAIVGTPEEAAEQVRAVAAEFDVDEVMVNPVASARRGTDPATAPARGATLELLAKELF